jgi:hypothetical protein
MLALAFVSVFSLALGGLALVVFGAGQLIGRRCSIGTALGNVLLGVLYFVLLALIMPRVA